LKIFIYDISQSPKSSCTTYKSVGKDILSITWEFGQFSTINLVGEIKKIKAQSGFNGGDSSPRKKYEKKKSTRENPLSCGECPFVRIFK
jgi:hypothetical protein